MTLGLALLALFANARAGARKPPRTKAQVLDDYATYKTFELIGPRFDTSIAADFIFNIREELILSKQSLTGEQP